MIYYTSDLHLGHKNILRLSDRPFADLDEMHQTIRDNWNSIVTDKDEVYILGDVAFKLNEEINSLIASLKGRKHLIIGNHDKKFLGKEKFRAHFETIQHYLEIEDSGRTVILFHYPIAEWDGFYHDTYHLYGHIHNTTGNLTDDIITKIKSKGHNMFNVGVDVNDFVPVTLDRLCKK